MFIALFFMITRLKFGFPQVQESLSISIPAVILQRKYFIKA